MLAATTKGWSCTYILKKIYMSMYFMFVCFQIAIGWNLQLRLHCDCRKLRWFHFVFIRLAQSYFFCHFYSTNRVCVRMLELNECLQNAKCRNMFWGQVRTAFWTLFIEQWRQSSQFRKFRHITKSPVTRHYCARYIPTITTIRHIKTIIDSIFI